MEQATDIVPSSTSLSRKDDKLSRQLVIKAQLGDDIRKMMIFHEDLTLNELVLMMQRIFSGKISNSDELTIKYLDNDGDLITLTNDSDLTLALHFCQRLRLIISINDAQHSSKSHGASSTDINSIHNELIQIRNSVQQILDRFPIETNVRTEKQQEKDVPPPLTLPPAPVFSPTHESDPLNNRQQQRRPYTSNNVRSRLIYAIRKGIDEQETSTVPSSQNPSSPPGSVQSSEASSPGTPPTVPSFIPRSFPSPLQSNNPSSSLPATPSISSPTQGQISSFIGQQPQSNNLYGSTQSLYQQKAAPSALGSKYSRSIFNRQQSATPPSTPTVPMYNPLGTQTPPPPPPLASQVPYGGQQAPGAYYNPNQPTFQST